MLSNSQKSCLHQRASYNVQSPNVKAPKLKVACVYDLEKKRVTYRIKNKSNKNVRSLQLWYAYSSVWRFEKQVVLNAKTEGIVCMPLVMSRGGLKEEIFIDFKDADKSRFELKLWWDGK